MAPKALHIPYPRSIRARLVALVLAVALPLLALIAYDYVTRLTSRLALAGNSAQQLATRVAASLTQLIDNERAMLAELAQRPAQRVERPAVCDPLVAEALTLNPYRANVTVTTASGEVVCSAVPLPAGGPTSVIDLDYAQRVLRTGLFTVGEPFQGRITGRWVVPLVVPRRDMHDQIIGWVGVPLDVEQIGDLLARGAADRGDVIAVVSPQGRMVSRSADAVRWAGADVRAHPGAGPLLADSLGGWQGPGLDGVARIWRVAEVPLAGWKVLVGVNEAQLLAPAKAELARDALLIALLLVLVGVAATGIVRAIAQPIRAQARVLAGIAKGERDLRAPLTGISEVDQIALEMNNMLDALAVAEADSARAVAETQAADEKLRLFVHLAPAAIAMFDREMRYIAFSQRWITYYKLQDVDITGRSLYDVFPDIPPHWKAVHQRCLAGASESADEEQFPRKDGSLDWVRWAVHPWRAADGAIGGIILFGEVITERKRAEQALADSRARLEALTRRLLDVQEAERRMIARELHDEVGSTLTAVKLNLQSLRRSHTDAQREEALADALSLVDGIIQSVRSLSLDLRPAMLDDLGLIPALKWYCERQAQRSGIVIELALDAIDLKAVPQLESACFRIVQEALTNAVRHAQAQRITVALRRIDGHFVLEISDDGVGFDAPAARARSQAGESGGLLGMAERVGLLGGHFGIDSTPGVGTLVWAEFAMPEGGFS